MTETTTDNATTSRVPLVEDGLLAKAISWYSRRTYGVDMEPMQALLHHKKATLAIGMFEMRLAKWNSVERPLKGLAELLVASRIGCSWCMDYGYYALRTDGMSREKLEQVATWEEASVFTPLERAVLGYAEAMTNTPPTVTDEIVAGLREQLSDEQLVELTAMIAQENFRSRCNSALGLTSQGFKDHCDLPAPEARR